MFRSTGATDNSFNIGEERFYEETRYFFRHAWCDAGLWAPLIGMVLLAWGALTGHPADIWLKENLGYGLGMLFGVLFVLGALYGLYLAEQTRIAIFIEDEVMTGMADINMTFCLFYLPITILIFSVLFIESKDPGWEILSLVLVVVSIVCLIFAVALQVVRAYHYNVSGFRAFISILTKVALALITLIFMVVSASALTDKAMSWARRILEGLFFGLLAWSTYSFMRGLIYRGPSLRYFYIA
jgi:hypothetical protein